MMIAAFLMVGISSYSCAWTATPRDQAFGWVIGVDGTAEERHRAPDYNGKRGPATCP